MATDGGATAAAPTDPGLERPAFLELFFDLVYVFALVTLATVLSENLSWTGLARTLVLLLGFAMIWALTVWAADSVDLTRPAGQGQFIWVAAASLLLAALAPDAYDDHALPFAITYVVIHLSASAYYVLVVSIRKPPRRSIRIQVWEAIAACRLDRRGARRRFGTVGDLGARGRRRVCRSRVRLAGAADRSLTTARLATGRRAGG